MSGGGMQLDGNQQKFKEKKEFVIDTKKKSELLKDEKETNGYNLIVEPPKLLKRQDKQYDKKDLSVQKGKTATEQIKKMVSAQEQKVSQEASNNLENVSSCITELSELFGENMPMPHKDKQDRITKDAIKKCLGMMNVGTGYIIKQYESLIMSLDTCLKNEHGETDNEEFKRVLTDLKKQCEDEKENFKDKALQYQSLFINDPKRKDRIPTWGEALEFARGEYYDLGQYGNSFIKVKDSEEETVLQGKEDQKGKVLTINKKNQGDNRTLADNSRVAATKMAGMLGAEQMMCASKTAFIKEDDSLFRGVVTEEAGGVSMENALKDQEKLRFGIGALAQMFQLQTLDALCGVAQRGADNMNLVMNKEGTVTGIKVTDLFEKPVTLNVIAALPTEFLNKIFNIQKPVLDMIFAGTLSKEEINKLWQKVSSLQKTIAKCFRYDMKYREEMARRDEFYKETYLSYEKGFEDDDHRMMQAMNQMQQKNEIQDTNIPEDSMIEQNN
jgi:hypothetical protein